MGVLRSDSVGGKNAHPYESRIRRCAISCLIYMNHPNKPQRGSTSITETNKTAPQPQRG